MIHNRLMTSKEERDSLRSYLADRNIYTSIHWPTHQRVLSASDDVDISGTLWLEAHIISFPVSEDYNLNDMEHICEAIGAWQREGNQES